ncbi:MAG: transporter permease [Ilumatobacteraceae bacterium]|nr:transporter permease [Ilumatobacteraceae bacterium]
MSTNTTGSSTSSTTANTSTANTNTANSGTIPGRGARNGTYLRYELLRTVRNRRFLIFSLVIPLVLLLVIAGPNRHATLGGLPFATYYMTGMVSYGSMAAVIAGGARIAAERSVGWNRQLRVTPLRPSMYLSAKVVTGYALAIISIVLLYIAGISLGVRMPAGRWIEMTALILVGLIPFAALGVVLGHLLTVDSMGPAMGGLTSLFALLGGSWGPIAEHGIMHSVSESLPSYWLVQSGHVGLGMDAWPAKAWIVIAIWSIVLVRLAVWAYQRDTSKV